MGKKKVDLAHFEKKIKAASFIFLDSMVFIYHFEKNPQYVPLTMGLFSLLESGKAKAFTSVLSLVEALSSPPLEGEPAKLNDLRRFFLKERNLALIDITWEIGDYAAGLRRKYDLATPDAIQLATAKFTRCRLFMTNDDSFRKIKDFSILFLSDFVR